MLIKIVMSGKLDPKKLISHHFKLNEIIKAYETFENAEIEKTLKVILTN
jgi:alcohol dehydrogenase